MSRVSVEEEENKLRKKGICVCTVDFGDAASTKRFDNICCIDAVTLQQQKLRWVYTKNVHTPSLPSVLLKYIYISKEYIVLYTVLYCHATFTKHIIQLIAGREPAYNSSAPLLYYYVYSLNDITLCIIVTHNRLYSFYIIIHI